MLLGGRGCFVAGVADVATEVGISVTAEQLS